MSTVTVGSSRPIRCQASWVEERVVSAEDGDKLLKIAAGTEHGDIVDDDLVRVLLEARS